MNRMDAFAAQLLEEAKWHLESAASAPSDEKRAAYCHAALLVGVSALEAHLNALCEELALRPSLTVLEKSMLLEKDYQLNKGAHELSNKLKMYRLVDRLEFVFVRFTKAKTAPRDAWWSQIKKAIELRNGIVHPKEAAALSKAEVERALNAILDCLNALYLGVFRKRHPAFGRGVTSSIGA